MWEIPFVIVSQTNILQFVRTKIFRLSIRLMAAVIAFAIGLAISRLLRLPAVEESIQPVTITAAILVRPQTPELPDLAPEPNLAEGSDLSIGIQFSQPGPNPPFYELRYIKLSKRGTTIVGLDMTEYVDKSEVTLNFRDSSAEYRILQQYRTSMSVSAEGPHLDLIDWRHYDSPWKSLKSLGRNRFRTLPAGQMQDIRFPKTSKSDIVKEVRRQVGHDWPYLLELVQSCNGPNEGACLVAISSIYLRIQKQVRGRWVDVGLVDFRVAMGC
jgi:hypothetical protein